MAIRWLSPLTHFLSPLSTWYTRLEENPFSLAQSEIESPFSRKVALTLFSWSGEKQGIVEVQFGFQ